MNSNLEAALTYSINELVVDVTPEQIGDILDICKVIKYDHLISQLSDSRIQAEVWDSFRKNKSLMAVIFTATTTFVLKQSDELETNIARLARSMVISENSQIVDRDFLDGIIPYNEAVTLLTQNLWLYWLIVLTLNLSQLIEYFDAKVIKSNVR